MKQGTSGHASIHVDAPPEKVWAAVTDVTRMGEWSPETVKGEWLDGATGPVVGARFKGSNKRGVLRWSTKPTVVAADEGREFAFDIDGVTKWTYTLTADDGGTQLSESFEMLKDVPWFYAVVERYVMRVKDRRADLEAAMQTTLDRIKHAVEGTAIWNAARSCEPAGPSGEQVVMDLTTDAEVIAGSCDRPEAFGAIFDRHATVVFRYLVRRVGVDDAETLLGETFRIAFEKRETYDITRPNARPWLYGIATNLLARHRRGEARRLRAMARVLARDEPELDASDSIVATLDAGELWPRIADAIDALPAGERDALVLFVWEDLGYDDIATALSIPVGTVRSRLNRARQTLRDLRAPIGRER